MPGLGVHATGHPGSLRCRRSRCLRWSWDRPASRASAKASANKATTATARALAATGSPSGHEGGQVVGVDADRVAHPDVRELAALNDPVDSGRGDTQDARHGAQREEVGSPEGLSGLRCCCGRWRRGLGSG